MEYGVLLLRLVVGLLFAAHGSQKLFGWFEGPGPAGVRGFVTSLGFRAPTLQAWLLTVAEFFGGLLFAFGFLTPLAAVMLTIDMLVAIWVVHWPNFFSSNNGLELPLTLAAVAVAVTATGPGRFSLDRALSWDDEITGVWWGAGVLAVAVIAAAFLVTVGRTRQQPAEVPA